MFNVVQLKVCFGGFFVVLLNTTKHSKDTRDQRGIKRRVVPRVKSLWNLTNDWIWCGSVAIFFSTFVFCMFFFISTCHYDMCLLIVLCLYLNFFCVISDLVIVLIKTLWTMCWKKKCIQLLINHLNKKKNS